MHVKNIFNDYKYMYTYINHCTKVYANKKEVQEN